METVKLRNGSEEFVQLVKWVTALLESLMQSNPLDLYELGQLCRDSTHTLFSNTGKSLSDLGLLDGDDGEYRVHDSIRNIVLSAVEGDGLEMRLVSPGPEETGG